MIDARELRIGNWILNGIVPTIPIGILSSDDYLDADGCEYDLSDCNGLPLNDRWLLKFGFKKYPLGYGLGEDTHFVLMIRNGCLYYGDLKIEYVHKLQNIYYALHDKELTTTNL